MIKIGIELNHVVRNINKQILKYYSKDIDPSLDLDEIDEKDDVFTHVNFPNRKAMNEFIYIDYPYEIFGCAKAMSSDLPGSINKWLYELTNYEDDDVEVFYYSLNEDALTIQSSYFFLSKIGTRVRKVMFPTSYMQAINAADVIVTANDEVLKAADGKYKIRIKTNFNSDSTDDVNDVYDSLEEMMKDDELLNKLYNYTHKDDGKTVL